MFVYVLLFVYRPILKHFTRLCCHVICPTVKACSCVSFGVAQGTFREKHLAISIFKRLYRVSQKKRPAFERLLLPEYISNDILQYLIKKLTCSIIFGNFPG